MLRVAPEAAAYILAQNKPIFLDIPPAIGTCCIHLKESPAVRFGEPYDPENYAKQSIDGVTVFVPYDLPEQPLTVVLNSFLGIKNLSVQGWHLA